MELNKITDNDLVGKGVLGQEDVPGLSAEDMQKKIEEIVREIAIPKINEVIEYIIQQLATQDDLEKLSVASGAVTSVFGRAGTIKARTGDYTAKMVGAAEEIHAAQHFKDGADPITAEDIGAAKEVHVHGNISNDGRIGNTNGLFLMTGISGKIETVAKENSGLVVPPTTKEISGAFTAENNVVYFSDGLSDFVFTCDEDKTASCHGWVIFGAPGNISMTGFDYIDDPEEIETATAGSRWEFDLEKGCLIIRKRSE